MAKFVVMIDSKVYEVDAATLEYEQGGGGITTLKSDDGGIVAVIRGGTVLPAGSQVSIDPIEAAQPAAVGPYPVETARPAAVPE